MRYGTLIFDLEGNGLLDKITRVHVLKVKEVETGKRWSFLKHEIDNVFTLFDEAEFIVGHNIIDYDLKVLLKLFGYVTKAKVRDTIVYSRLMYPNIAEMDMREFNRGLLPGKLIGRHSLEAWGHRVGLNKGEYSEIMRVKAKEAGLKTEEEILNFIWGEWNPEMDAYCDLDVDVTEQVWIKASTEFDVMGWPILPLQTEHYVAELMRTQEDNGICFNVEDASKMKAELNVIAESISAECQTAFPPRFVPESYVNLGDIRLEYNKIDWDKVGDLAWEDAVFDLLSQGEASDVVPKIVIPRKTLRFKDVSRPSKFVGHPYIPVEMDIFNPGSRPQVANRLIAMGWTPDEFTDSGAPSVNDDTLKRAAETIPIAQPISDYYMVNKRLSQLSTGDEAWLSKVTPDGFIHHNVNPCGAVTGRATHRGPNLAQVPKVVKKKRVLEDGTKEEYIAFGREGGWGYECRALFHTPPGFRMVGSDLSGIELRCLAHYMAEHDGGEYGRILLKEDIHKVNQEAAGLENRDLAKTFIYAFLYGAGDEKIGSIVAPEASPAQQKSIGAELKKRFLKGLPALGKVLKGIKKDLKTQGHLIGLDGRRLYCRSEHSALNTLLQAAGAIISKYWILQIDDDLIDAGYENRWVDYANMLWIHDEVQIAARDDIAENVAVISVAAAGKVGNFLNFRVPVEANAKIGRNWAETH